jgi:hypothetical protein
MASPECSSVLFGVLKVEFALSPEATLKKKPQRASWKRLDFATCGLRMEFACLSFAYMIELLLANPKAGYGVFKTIHSVARPKRRERVVKKDYSKPELQAQGSLVAETAVSGSNATT